MSKIPGANVKTAIAIRHLVYEDLDSLAVVLENNNFSIQYLDAGVMAPRPAVEADLAIVLGGPIGANDETDYPFLIDELQVIEQRLAKHRPTLGICLGAQLMARALGARVHSGVARELGWLPLNLTEAGRASPLAALGDGELMFQWHSDQFDVPENAVHLASSSGCANQAFCYGGNALAVQFHPEVTAQNLERWYVGNTRELRSRNDISVCELRAQGRKFTAGLERRAGEFLVNWLQQVGLLG